MKNSLCYGEFESPLNIENLLVFPFLMALVYPKIEQFNQWLREELEYPKYRVPVFKEEKRIIKESLIYFLKREGLVPQLSHLFFDANNNPQQVIPLSREDRILRDGRQLFIEYCTRHDITRVHTISDAMKAEACAIISDATMIIEAHTISNTPLQALLTLNKERQILGKTALPPEIIVMILQYTYPDTATLFAELPKAKLCSEKAKHKARTFLIKKTFDIQTGAFPDYKALYDQNHKQYEAIAQQFVDFVCSEQPESDNDNIPSPGARPG